MSKGFASTPRVTLLATLTLLCFAAISARLVALHILDRETYLPDVTKARRQVTIEKARRGDIVDTRNDTLATSRSTIILAVDPQIIGPEAPDKWRQLATLANIPYPTLLRTCTTKTRTTATTTTDTTATTTDAPDPDDTAPGTPIRYAKLADEITETTYAEIKKLNIPGLIGTRVWRRVYPHNQLAAQLIGYVNKEDTPAAGLEAYANQYLFAADGWRETEKDGRQRELAQFRTRQVDSANGYTIKLSLDSLIQTWAEEELAALAQKYNPKRATIIITDARDGFLLALANHPTYDLNQYNRAPMDVMKNYAITDQIDPGSTFKIVAASAALEEKLVTPATTFDCTTPTITYKNKPLTLMPDDHRWDHPLTVAEIISHSSNRGAAQLAMRLGEQRFYDYALKFGFAARTGFPYGGEIPGLLAPPAKWTPIDITRIPAGYSISATPLQIHYAMATIASGGELLLPQIIREVRDPDGNPILTFTRQARRRVISPETAATMRRLLQGTVSPGGTAAKIYLPGYQFAGKTGTAQKLIDGRYSTTNHIASFTGFFPASNPRVVITIIVDDATMPAPTTAAYGAIVAAPSFKTLAEKLIPYLDIKPTADPGATPLLPQRTLAAAPATRAR